MKLACICSLLLIACYSVISAPVNWVSDEERPCGTTWSKLWLDIVFVVDNSQEMTDETLAKVVAHMKKLMDTVKIGLHISPQTTRVGLVTFNIDATLVADLNAFTSYEDFSGNLTSFLNKVSSEDDCYLASGLDLAAQVFENGFMDSRKHFNKVVIVYTSTYDSYGDPPMTEAKHLTDNGVKIMTVATNDMNYLANSLGNMAYKGWSYNLANQDSIELMQQDLMINNCYCPHYWEQTKDMSSGAVYGTCVIGVGENLSWIDAKNRCPAKIENSYLVNEMSFNKHQFVYAVVKRNGHIPAPYRYHIGLSYFQGRWQWERPFSQPQKEASYTNWEDGYPKAAYLNVSTVSVPSGIDTQWESINMNNDLAYLACEMVACDTDNYCDSECM